MKIIDYSYLVNRMLADDDTLAELAVNKFKLGNYKDVKQTTLFTFRLLPRKLQNFIINAEKPTSKVDYTLYKEVSAFIPMEGYQLLIIIVKFLHKSTRI